MRKITLNGTEITQDSPAYVIAEIGHNHGGSLVTAIEMMEAAQQAGADAVKFQKRDNETLYTAGTYNEPYHSENAFGDTYGQHREALEFDRTNYLGLTIRAIELGIEIFATPFDFKSVDFLEYLSCPFYKVASGDMNNYPLIKYIQQTGKPVIISTGGRSLDDILTLKDQISLEDVAIMHCTATYPTKAEDLNIRFIGKLMEIFPDNIIGLSSHYPGIVDAPLAYMAGARIIEKHFTLSRSSKGTDHAFSLPPDGLKKMISYLKEARAALELKQKIVLDEEVEPIRKMGKSPYVNREVKRGEEVGPEDLELRSPAGFYNPQWLRLAGISSRLIAKKDLTPDTVLDPMCFDVLECEGDK